MEMLATGNTLLAGRFLSYGAARIPFFAGTKSVTAFQGLQRVSTENRPASGVVSVQAKGRKNVMQGRTPSAPTPVMPKLDEDDNPKFVIFIRTKNVPRWYPVSIVSGGTTAKMMLATMNNEWGKKLYASTLTRNMASVIYKDERAIRQIAFKTHSVLKAASEFSYGYKIVDLKNPKSAFFASDVIEIPPEGELVSFVDKLKDSFSNLSTGVKDTFGSISPVIPEPQAESTSEPESKPVAKQTTKKKAK